MSTGKTSAKVSTINRSDQQINYKIELIRSRGIELAIPRRRMLKRVSSKAAGENQPEA
jgi:hypothetical protein